MRVSKVLHAKAARFMALNGPVYLPDVVREIEQQYGFLVYPKTPEEILIPPDGSRAMMFAHGKLSHDGRDIVVDSLELYANAIAVVTSSSTADSDLVIDDFLSRGAPRVTSGPGPRIYVSQLEVVLDATLDHASKVADLGAAISAAFGGRVGREVAPFRISAIVMAIDPTTKNLIPADFRIERRVGFDYDINVYFSLAPLPTDEHIGILEAYERLYAPSLEKLGSNA